MRTFSTQLPEVPASDVARIVLKKKESGADAGIFQSSPPALSLASPSPLINQADGHGVFRSDRKQARDGGEREAVQLSPLSLRR